MRNGWILRATCLGASYAEDMDPTTSLDGSWALLVAGLVGVAVGLAAAFAFRTSERTQQEVPEQPRPTLDEGVLRVLAVVRSAVIVLGLHDDVVRASAAAYALGLVRADQLVHPEIRELVSQVRRDGTVVDEEIEVTRGPLGKGRLVLAVRVAHLTNDDLVIFADDRTEARRIEEVRQDFAVNVSHELKTPVGAISLLAETLEDAAGDPQAVRHFARSTRLEAQRLAELVHDIIELSRLQGAGALIQPVAVDVDAVLTEAVDRARTVAAASEHTIVVPPPSGAVVHGDHDLLVTAVRNLVDNAVAYSPRGSSVRIGVRVVDGIVEIAVVDQGMGIPAEQRERIFERFFRVDAARSRDTGGTGLGLSIVKHVAIDHGGEVVVWSEEGRGSTFTLRIPQASATDDVRQDGAGGAENQEPPSSDGPTRGGADPGDLGLAGLYSRDRPAQLLSVLRRPFLPRKPSTI